MSSEGKTDEETSEQMERLEEEYRRVPKERETLGRGPEVVRNHLRKAARRKKQLTIRLDADIVDRFKTLAGPDGSYQSLINRALHEWLEAQSVRGLLRTELDEFADLVEELRKEGQRGAR